ncbi:MAG TPA: YCF48-related protein, partial [Bacteroidota bacterium]|nr:YCF48-related protein [Bacteroidota bacterium]
GWIATDDSGIVFFTEDGGSTWTKQYVGKNIQLRTISFTDANHGWICGDTGVVVHTTNGGISWQIQNTGTTTYLWCIDFVDSLHGFVAGGRYTDYSTVFLKTSNGGNSWNTQTPSWESLFYTSFINADTGWVVGRGGTILKTTNGGANWIDQSYQGLWMTDVYAMSKDTVYVFNPGINNNLLVSTNGGNDWLARKITINPPINTFNQSLTVVDVPNDNGKQVFIKWALHSSLVNSGITNFSIYRYDNVNGECGWTYLKDVSASNDTIYQTIVPTLFDSTITQGLIYSKFMVLGRTAVVSIYDTIGIDSGYSVDNLPPLAPTSGSVMRLQNGNIIVQWHAVPNSYGDFKEYVLYRSTQQNFALSLETRVASIQDTTYTDINTGGAKYYYKVTAKDYSGNESPELNIGTITGVEQETSQLPHAYSLEQNYPNPFNPSTQIQFSIKQTGSVLLKVYNLMGQEVETLVSQTMEPGTYTVQFNASSLASGMYFYRLQSGTYVATKKMLMIK